MALANATMPSPRPANPILSLVVAFTANPALGVATVKELVELAKKQPGKLTFSSAGIAAPAHFAGELFKVIAGIDMTHVPYKGAAPAMTATITFELDGRQVEARPGETIWEVAQRHGTRIPHLCWHPAPGYRADLALYEMEDVRELPYWYGDHRCLGTWVGGHPGWNGVAS